MTSFNVEKTIDKIAFASRNNIVISSQSSSQNSIAKSFQFQTNVNDLISTNEKSSNEKSINVVDFVIVAIDVIVIQMSFRRNDEIEQINEESSFDDEIDYILLRTKQEKTEKKTTNKREYLLSMKKIKRLTFDSLRKSEINSSIIESIKFERRRRKKIFTNDNDVIRKNDHKKRVRSKTFNEFRLKHLNLYKNKNIRKYQIWIRDARWIFEINFKYFKKLKFQIRFVQRFFENTSTKLWNVHKIINQSQNDKLMTWTYFQDYLHRQIENFKNRRFDVDQKHHDIKQKKRFVFEFVVYFESLKIELNIIDDTKRDKFLFDLNDNIKKIIMTNDILSTIRQNVLIKVINIERMSIFSIFFERFQKNRNASFKNDRNNKNDRIQIKNDSSTQFDKFKENNIENSFNKRCENVENKFKFNLCYNCDQIEHKTKKCFKSFKKNTTNVNAIRKNKIKIKILSRIIEIDDNNSKNWKNLSSSSSLSKQIRINSNSMKFSFESTSIFRKNDNRKWISWMKSLT